MHAHALASLLHSLGCAAAGSKTSLGGVEADATRSVHSMGMESERSAASTNLADLVVDSSETSAYAPWSRPPSPMLCPDCDVFRRHLDNLMGLNERGSLLLCPEGEQQDMLEQLMP